MLNNEAKRTAFRPLAVICAAFMLAALVFASSLEAHHIDHDCTGETCPVCSLVAIVRTALRTLVFAGAVTATVHAFFAPEKDRACKQKQICAPRTLVAEKVKLSA